MPRRPSAQVTSDRRALAKAFPQTFIPPRTGQPKKPLKIGIFKELMKRTIIGEDGRPITRKRLGNAFTDYIRGYRYHAAGAAGGEHIDLEGKPAGLVTEEQRLWHQGLVQAMDRGRERASEKRRLAAASAIPQAAE